MTFSIPSINESKRYSTGQSSILPASIFEKSSTSFIMDNNDSAAVCIVSTYSCSSGVSSHFSRISAIPHIAFIGVLISCDIFARNVDFALFASSAACLASISLWFACLIRILFCNVICIIRHPNALLAPITTISGLSICVSIAAKLKSINHIVTSL